MLLINASFTVIKVRSAIKAEVCSIFSRRKDNSTFLKEAVVTANQAGKGHKVISKLSGVCRDQQVENNHVSCKSPRQLLTMQRSEKQQKPSVSVLNVQFHLQLQYNHTQAEQVGLVWRLREKKGTWQHGLGCKAAACHRSDCNMTTSSKFGLRKKKG